MFLRPPFRPPPWKSRWRLPNGGAALLNHHLLGDACIRAKGIHQFFWQPESAGFRRVHHGAEPRAASVVKVRRVLFMVGLILVFIEVK